MNRKKVSFDFDNTLSLLHIQEYAKLLVEKEIELWIVTRRYDDTNKYTQDFLKIIGVTADNLEKEHQYLFEVANKLGIPKERIIFMNMNPKYLFFKDNPDFVWHLDDDWSENAHITDFTSVKSITWVGNRRWQEECSRFLFD